MSLERHTEVSQYESCIGKRENTKGFQSWLIIRRLTLPDYKLSFVLPNMKFKNSTIYLILHLGNSCLSTDTYLAVLRLFES